MYAKGELRFVGIVEEADKQESKIRVFQDYCAALKGITSFSHIIILYWAHLRDHDKERRVLLVFPRKHAVNVETGVFACRSPSRPNPICLCVVELMKANGCTLTVKGLDALKDSPIVDIKPYIPQADSIPDATVPNWTSRGPKT